MTVGLFSSLKAVSVVTGSGRYGAVTVGKMRRRGRHSITACVVEEASALPHTGFCEPPQLYLHSVPLPDSSLSGEGGSCGHGQRLANILNRAEAKQHERAEQLLRTSSNHGPRLPTALP